MKRISTISVRLPRLPVGPRRDEPVRSPENRLDFRVSDSQKGAENTTLVIPSQTFLRSFSNSLLCQHKSTEVSRAKQISHSVSKFITKVCLDLSADNSMSAFLAVSLAPTNLRFTSSTVAGKSFLLWCDYWSFFLLEFETDMISLQE